MSDDDPHVSRIIRTPGSVISIRGTLSDVDRIYRLTTHTLLENGYGLKSPDESSWSNFGAPVEENADHLRRRLNQLEQQLADSADHDLIQSLRRQLLDMTLDRDTYRSAFTDLDDTIRSAVVTLDTNLTPRESIVRDILTLE